MKSSHRLTALLALIALTILPLAHAADLKSPDEILNFALAKNEEYQSFTADFTQSMSGLGTKMTFNGTMQFKKPALMRMEMVLPIMGHAQRMLVVMGPDKMMWQEVTMGGQTNFMKMDFQAIPTNNPAAAAMKNPLETVDPKKQLMVAMNRYNFELLPASEQPDQSLYVLQGTLKPGAKLSPQESAFLGGLGPQRISIGQHDGFLHRMQQFDKSGSNAIMSIEFTNLKFNPPLPDDLFIFKPPADANIIDLTQILLQKMQLSGRTASKPVNVIPPDAK